MNETFYKLNLDGSIQEVVVNTRGLTLTEKFKDELASGTLRKLHACFHGSDINELLGNAPVNAAIVNSAGDATWTVTLPFLPMTTHWKVSTESIMTPSFSRQENPLASIMWKPLDDMRLVWVVCVSKYNDGMSCGNQFLLAVSKDGILHKLPISNLYDDCRVCTGDFNGYGKSHIECLAKGFDQLMKSQWQGDLYEQKPDSYKERTDRLFRFKPAQKDGFEQMPPVLATGKTWKNYCDVVATEWFTKNITL